MRSSKQQNNSAAVNTKVTQVANAGTYTESDKHRGLAAQGYTPCAQLLQTDHEYCASLQTSISSITSVQTLMYTQTLYEMSLI